MKYRYIFIFSLFVICHFSVFSKSKTDSLLAVLNQTIKDSPKYDADKINAIESLKKKFTSVKNSDLILQFQICEKLYEEYRIFNFDSAFIYTKKMQVIGEKLNNPSFIASAKINFGFILLSSGLFKEAIEILTAINFKSIPDSLKANYYSLLARYYFDLSDYNNGNFYSINYTEKANQYLDSSLSLYSKNSFEYNYYRGLKNLKKGNFDSAIMAFRKIIDKTGGLTEHQYALATSTLSGLYTQKKQPTEAIDLLIEAAIADIKSSTKETTAILYLASNLFDNGDTKDASSYIEKANSDAQFYGARQRKIQIGIILPIIEGKVINTIEDQKRNLLRYSVIITVLFLTVILLVVIIRKQLNKLKIAKDVITKAHLQEQEINQLLNEANRIKDHFNQQLKASNHQLLESNKIKEEYIGYFFHADYKLLQKFEILKSSIEKKMTERKFDEIRFLLQNTNVKQEKDELLHSFDKIFIRLFPNFVKEFNSLFAVENQIVLKDAGVLNTELRIFALMRIGISENEKIAQILDYSVNTIYTYKTKIRNKSLVSNEEFEHKLYIATTLDI